MHAPTLLRVLRSTAAASAIALGSTAAQAECTRVNGVVTCTGANTTDQVNGAVNQSPPPSVSLVVAQDATVTRGNASFILPNNPPFNAAIGYTNSGTVGTPGANVDFLYFGSTSFFNGVANPANTFTFANSGVQNGAIVASGVGGAISGTNSGTVTRGIFLRAAGSISFTNSGIVSTNNPFAGNTAISLISQLLTFQTGSDGVTRETVTGGPITATISGTVGVPATSTSAVQPQGVFASSVGGVDLVVNGRAGSISATSSGNASERSFTFTSTSRNQSSDARSIGSDARVTIGATGRVSNVSVLSSTGTATAIVNGTVDGTPFGSTAVTAASTGRQGSFRSTETSTFNPFSRDSASSESARNTGGVALAEISSTGRVTGGVTAASNASSATVRIAGQVAAGGSQVSAASTGVNSSQQGRSVVRPDGSSEGSGTSTASLSGGDALVAVASTGDISFGFVNATGDSSATIDNAGRIRTSVSADSNVSLETDSSFSNSRTIVTDATGTRREAVQFDSSRTNEVLGGTANVLNRAGATIEGTVRASGVRGATLDNAGTVRGSVSLNSTGSRSVATSAERITITTAPAASGGTITTSVRDTSTTTAARATGGAATGSYSGTVGVAQSSNSNGFITVQQSGSTASTAAVTGTLFANFTGTAGGQNRDTANTSNRREVTQPNRSSTREQSSTSRETVTQIASTSSLTVAASGRIVDNGSGTGNVRVTSLGGDAAFTIDGGQVDGNVTVEGAAGRNLTQTSSESATFTRAPVSPNTFVPEVQQTQTSASTRDERQSQGTATVTVNGGTVGGNILAIGSGTGAGSLGANVVMNGTVTGGLAALSTGANNRSDTNSVATRIDPNTVTGTTVTNNRSAPSENGGGVLVTVGGTVGGGLLAGTDTADATVNLTGSVGSLSPDGVTVRAFDFTTQRQTTTTSAGTSFFFLTPTSSVSTLSSTASGGAATLNVTANDDIRTAGTSSIEGDVLVQGFAGSALNVAAGSRLVQETGNVLVGATFADGTSTTTATFANGVQTGSTVTSAATFIGGLASVNNAGTIGSATNSTTVTVAGIGGANLTNTGTINGSIIALARAADRSTTATTTNFNDPLRRRIVSTSVLTAVGGPVQVDNAALVTGDITVVGATGTVTNSGVVRGGVTLGGSFSNFSTTTTVTNSITSTGDIVPTAVASPSVANPNLFTQTYTLNQNGLLLGGVNVTGTTTIDPSGATVRTSNVNATVNLNSGSITLGNITAAADTNTSVNLNGSGFLGVAANDLPRPVVVGQVATGFQPTPSLARFTAIDPALGATVSLPAGSRVSGVQTLTKNGDGTFVIVGAPFVAATGTAAPTYTLDIGTLRVSGGELQLGLAAAAATASAIPGEQNIRSSAVSNPPASGIFGIRGNVENNANLVLGRRITNGSQTAIQGINISVLGNLNNATAGNLIVGVNPDFVRASAPPPGANPFAGTPPPFVAFGPNSSGLASTNSFVRVDGNLNLAGTVLVQGQSGALYEAGRAYDLFSVSGAYSNTGSVRSSFASPFISFTLTPRSEGGRTIVSLDVARANFDTVTTDRNSTAAAGALQAALPSVFAGLRSGSASANVQDLANIVAALDTQLTADQAAQVFRELSSGAFYGSLSAVSTTIPFGEATDGLPVAGDRSGIGLWLRPTGQFARYRANEDAGAAAIELDNHGGSVGLNYSTGSGGNFGIAGGYGRIDVNSGISAQAEADTYMVGVYGSQQLGRLHLSAQAVYGRSDWTAVRALPLLGRTATSSFESDEVRGSVRAAYTIAMLPGIDFSPFARVELRRYSFDGFQEAGANGVSLAVAERSKTVISPELGARMSGSASAMLRPFAEVSYIFQGDVGSDRSMGLIGGGGQNFTVTGVDPRDSIKGAVGVAADVGAGTIFVRGDYHSGGDQQVGSVRGGLLFAF